MTSQTASEATCRFCAAPLELSVVDLGKAPLANSYIDPHRAAEPEPWYPLHVRVCRTCRLVQIEDVVPPDRIFSDYAYFSSYSTSWVDHARRFVEAAVSRWCLGPSSKIVEIGSNDGYLLKHAVRLGIPVLGVDPAANVAAFARAEGVPTEVAFFGQETASRLSAAGHAADLIAANNVLAHVPNINDFVVGLRKLLKPAGAISVEFPHLLRLIKGVQFDTIYHEHLSYLSLFAVERIFAAHRLRVFDVEELPTHGGSLRVWACHTERVGLTPTAGLLKVRRDESAAELDCDAGYAVFEARVCAVKAGLLAFLKETRAKGQTVVAYGAAAKGNTLFNYCGIDATAISYVVDRNPHKQGKLLPGSHIPIHAPERVQETRPDVLLILPWNLREEIAEQMAGIRSWGGCFAVAVPRMIVW